MANLPLRLAVRAHCAQYDGVHARVSTRRSAGASRGTHSRTLGVCRHRGTHGPARSEECEFSVVGRARLPLLLVRVRGRMTESVVAGARAARDSAACAEPAAAADGRRRCAARGARGGAGVAAVGAARDGLRGDREAQGALVVSDPAWSLSTGMPVAASDHWHPGGTACRRSRPGLGSAVYLADGRPLGRPRVRPGSEFPGVLTPHCMAFPNLEARRRASVPEWAPRNRELQVRAESALRPVRAGAATAMWRASAASARASSDLGVSAIYFQVESGGCRRDRSGQSG